MRWINFQDVGPPTKGTPCVVFKPHNKFCKYSIDEWGELWESPVSWSSATLCIGEGWQEEDDMDAISHWSYLDEPKEIE